MMLRPKLARLMRSNCGSAAVEFAILAPVIFSLMLGVLQLGLHMRDYNAVRAIAIDTARFTIVEYQKGNQLIDEQIQTKAIAYGVNAPYMLDSENLDVVISRPTTDVAGTIKMTVQVSYAPTSLLGIIGIGSPNITVTRPIYVAT